MRWWWWWKWWWWWWWEVRTKDSTLVLRLGLDRTGLGLGLDNTEKMNQIQNVELVFSFHPEQDKKS